MSVASSKVSWPSLGGGGEPSLSLCTTRRRVECVGPCFLSFWQTDRSSCPPRAPHDPASAPAEDEPPMDYRHDPDLNYLQNLDPKDWKNQDHYAVLGLKAQRFKATQDDVKQAYRVKMLMHHPDKRKQVIIRFEDDYFSCITRAWEVLGQPKTRRSYDSIDETLDDSIPSNNNYNKAHFYCVFSEAFERNAHWSKVQPVPGLGNEDSPRQNVDDFYSFWYNFQSWREFTYRESDDEDKDIAESRRLRKNEVSRIRKLVDLAYALDPRISVFKQDERERKLAEKERRKEQARARQEQAAKKAAAEETEVRLATEQQAAEAKEIQDLLKLERTARKRALKASRSKLYKMVKANGYYVANIDELVSHMMSLEEIINHTLVVDKLDQLVACLARKGREAFLSAVMDATRNSLKTVPLETSKRGGADSASWSEDELKLLEKSVKLYPCDRKYRWVLVADFVNQCSGNNAKTPKDVELKASELQSLGPSEAGRMASLEPVVAASGHVYANASSAAASNEAYADPGSDAAWSESELAALERGKRTFPAFTPRRWEKIASAVGSRTKDECSTEAKRQAAVLFAGTQIPNQDENKTDAHCKN